MGTTIGEIRTGIVVFITIHLLDSTLVMGMDTGTILFGVTIFTLIDFTTDPITLIDIIEHQELLTVDASIPHLVEV